MKTPLILALTCATLFTSCKKDDDNAPVVGGGGGGGADTTGTYGYGLVTSWSPFNPYRDQVVTFTGGPFNTDPAQNTITAWGEPFEILTVSSTQTTARPSPDMETAVPGYNSVIVTSGNAVDTIPYIYWKRPFNLLHFEDNLDDWIFGAPSRPGDSVVFNCISATNTGMSININGQSMPGPFAVDSNFYCTLAFRIPVSMGIGSDESTVTTAFMTATNSDGRTDTLTIGWAPTPDMEIFGLELIGGGSSFDLSDMIGGGQVLNFRVFGKYLHSGQTWTLTGPSGTVGAWGSGNYGSEAFIVVNPISMSAGTYNLWIDGTFIGYGFTLAP